MDGCGICVRKVLCCDAVRQSDDSCGINFVAGSVLCGYSEESEQRISGERFLSVLRQKHGVSKSLVIIFLCNLPVT